MTTNRVLIAQFTVAGEPVSKSRARFTKRGSKTMAYTPERTKAAEEIVKWTYLASTNDRAVNATHAFGIEAEFVNGTRQRRDVDNMLKLILDALNGVAWADDNQVTEVAGRKAWGTAVEAHTTVTVYRLDPITKPTRPCEQCGAPFETYASQSKRRYCSSACGKAARAASKTKTCANCGMFFIAKEARLLTCSKECGYNLRRVTLACNQCGAEFTKQRCHVKERNFCSAKCRDIEFRERRATRARGTCATCQGPTSKRSYRNCAACAARGVSGAPKLSGVAP